MKSYSVRVQLFGTGWIRGVKANSAKEALAKVENGDYKYSQLDDEYDDIDIDGMADIDLSDVECEDADEVEVDSD